jgi:hypothetical protein
MAARLEVDEAARELVISANGKSRTKASMNLRKYLQNLSKFGCSDFDRCLPEQAGNVHGRVC